MASTICSGAASVRVSKISSICLSVTGSSAGMSMIGSGTVVVDELCASNSVVSDIYSGGSVVSVGCSVLSGEVVFGIEGTVVSGMVVSGSSSGSGTVSSGTVVDVSVVVGAGSVVVVEGSG